MKIEKDVILAIIVGVLIGGLTAFFVFFLPKFFPKRFPRPKKEEAVKKEEVTVSPTPSHLLIVEAPQDEAVFSESKILVSGKTTPGALVAIICPTDEKAVEADGEGGFETEILLEEGANEISITSYHGDGEETKSVTVYYTEEEIE